MQETIMVSIVLITAHDLGRYLGCYSKNTVNSPHLDSLSQQGILFQNSFCTSPLCSPSRAALHTGRYAHANGMMGLAHNPFNWRLQKDEKHTAQRLREHGYTTALIGVQHLTNRPEDLGYDVVVRRGSAQLMGGAAAAFLRDRGREHQPFYLEVGFYEPHRPYNWGGATPDASKGSDLPPYLPESAKTHQEMAALQGVIRTMDQGVGIILDTLHELDMEQDTWVIFTTDHGIAMPRAKSTLYDPGIETALIMRWPAAGLQGGLRLPQMISNVDIAPTILEGVGIPLVPEMQGGSFWMLLQNESSQPRTEIFAEKTYHTYYEPMRCIRTPTHKLIVNLEVGSQIDVSNDIRQGQIYPQMLPEIAQDGVPIELYDLVNDPQERTNLAGQPSLADIETDLRDRLLYWMQATRDPILDGPIPSPYYQHVLDWLTSRKITEKERT
jgi:N-sulfoglucosamine sulfohydrolase